MNNTPLNLLDLVPRESTFTLAALPDKTFTLCKWSLRIRAWAKSKYTSEGLKNIFEKQQIEEIAEMAYFMLKEKDDFKSLDDFFDAICSVQDQVNVIMALLGAVGIGEPEIKAIDDSLRKKEVDEPQNPNVKSSKKKIGAKSLTP